MSERFTVSRRNAAALIVGTLAVSADAAARGVAAAGSARRIGNIADTSVNATPDRVRIARLVADVRCAPTLLERAKAFARLKAALRSEEPLAWHSPLEGELASDRTLYRRCDPSSVLANVIVRELDATPVADGAWISRFSDLEAVVHARAGSG